MITFLRPEDLLANSGKLCSRLFVTAEDYNVGYERFDTGRAPWNFIKASELPVFGERGFNPDALFRGDTDKVISAEVLESRLTTLNELSARKLGLEIFNEEFQKVDLARDVRWDEQKYGGRSFRLWARLPVDTKVRLNSSGDINQKRYLLISGDVIVDGGFGLAVSNQTSFVRRFEGTELKESIPVREFLLAKIPNEIVSIFRIMNEHEYRLWLQKDPEKLKSRSTRQMQMNGFEVPTYHFAVGKKADYFFSEVQNKVIRIDIPKTKLLEMAKQKKIDVGFLGVVFEISFKYEALDDLVPFIN